MKAKARVMLLGLFLGISSAFAYDFTEDFENGFYWETFPISFQKFVDSSAEGEVLNQLVSAAENEWENAVGVDLWNIADQYVVSSSHSGNHIRWSNDFAQETGYSPVSTLAVTIRHRVGTYFVRTEIILNGENERLRSNQGNLLYQTILHEMGHTLGIDHSEFSSAVMYPSVQGINRLSFDDQDAVVDVVDETRLRQEVGFVSALSTETSGNANALACGSVSLVTDSDSGDGPGSGAATVIMGFLLVIISSRARQILPVQSRY